MPGFAGLEPTPRTRALLSLRALNSLKKVFGENQPASLTVRESSATSQSRNITVTLSGSACGSSGSFCAVTSTGGSVTRGGSCVDCADPGTTPINTRATATTAWRVVLYIAEFSHIFGAAMTLPSVVRRMTLVFGLGFAVAHL